MVVLNVSNWALLTLSLLHLIQLPAFNPRTSKLRPTSPLSARLYLPKVMEPRKKLPLLIYFHGSGLVVQSAFSPRYQECLNTLTKEANVVAVSVECRLAPKTPIPGAFEDAWEAIKWAASESTDEWIKNHADRSRVYLGGDSAGANIAHNAAVRSGTEKLGLGEGTNYELKGMFFNCPFFWGEDPIRRECDGIVSMGILSKSFIESLWYCAKPGLSGLDEAWINPGKDEKLGRWGAEECWRASQGMVF